MNPNIQAEKIIAVDIARAIGVSEPDFATRTTITKAVRQAEQAMRKFRVRLLYETANLPSDSPRLLKRLELFDPTPQKSIAAVQEALQVIWKRDTPLETKEWLVDVLCVAANRSPYYAGLYASLGARNLLFAVKNFPGQILSGILEHWPRMAVCANPNCSAPYFFAKRSSQIYCERGECTQYSLRKKAREWWTENKAQLLAKRKARRRSAKQKSRKKRK